LTAAERAAAKTARLAEREAERAAVMAAKEEAQINAPLARADFMVAGHFVAVKQQRIRELKETCELPTRVILVREPDNRFSKNAVAVQTEDGRSIGYVPEDGGLGAGASEISALLADGAQQLAFITKYLSSDAKPLPVVKARLFRSDATLPDEAAPASARRPAEAPSSSLSASPAVTSWSAAEVAALVVGVVVCCIAAFGALSMLREYLAGAR
jgi:hypothetical protein